MVKVRKARPRVAELPGSVSIGGDTQVSNEEIAQLQAQIAQIQAAHSTEIQELQSQLLAASQSHHAELQDLAAKFEDFQQTKTTAHQPTIEKVIQLETEVDTLKKQLGQLIVLIKKNSRSPPIGKPKAILVTLVNGEISLPKYRVVVSPSTVGLTATITSLTSWRSIRCNRDEMFNCSVPMPSMGEITPPKT
jgi:hypothetical protein